MSTSEEFFLLGTSNAGFLSIIGKIRGRLVASNAKSRPNRIQTTTSTLEVQGETRETLCLLSQSKCILRKSVGGNAFNVFKCLISGLKLRQLLSILGNGILTGCGVRLQYLDFCSRLGKLSSNRVFINFAESGN
jgi:hypothetical protein